MPWRCCARRGGAAHAHGGALHVKAAPFMLRRRPACRRGIMYAVAVAHGTGCLTPGVLVEM
eukprot:345289-Chlamydomonas_euryale.AAC.6